MDTDDKKNIYLYQKLLDEFGEDYRSLDWGSRESQHLRFKILYEVGIQSGDSILDVGCGIADFYLWLQKNKPEINYSGLDLTPGMINYSKKRFPHIEFLLGTINDKILSGKKYDYLIASGIFVYRQNNPMLYMKKTIKKMYDLSKKGIAFNSLSSFSPNKMSNEFYANPTEVFKYCKSLDKNVVLRHDYHDSDFTIYLYKLKS